MGCGDVYYLEDKHYHKINGNAWRRSTFTYEQALEYSKTLVNCTECEDCIRCTDCFGCSECTDCINCTNCFDCHNCTNCNDCDYGCYRCDNCNDCEGCEDSRNLSLCQGYENKSYDDYGKIWAQDDVT